MAQMMTRDPVLTFTERGVYCPAGDFYIDPWRRVDRAIVTHAHSDHARPGMGHYLATPRSLAAMRHRLGPLAGEALPYGTERQIGGAVVSLHPAGHVPGSAQVRVEVKGEIWVVSGDYKTVADGLSEPFEPVRCHCFISESTFGLPVFRWDSEAALKAQINSWWQQCRAEGRTAVIGAYSLGKAQRVLAALEEGTGPILTHGAVEEMNAVLRDCGVALPETLRVTGEISAKTHPGAIVVAPPSALGSPWMRRFGPASQGFASGWMRLRGVRRRRAVDRGFVMSDHADWDGLTSAIAATGASRVFVTHGYVHPFRRWLESRGYEAGIVATDWQGEATDGGTPEGDSSDTGGTAEEAAQ